MKNLKFLFWVITLVFSMVLCSNRRLTAVEIPLDGGVISASGSGEVKSAPGGIAYLDIEMIFNEHPMTARLKSEFETEVEKKKKELSDIEASMKLTQDIIVSTTTEISKLKTEVEQIRKAIEEAQKPPQTVLLPGTTYTVIVPPPASAVKADPVLAEAKEKEIKDKEAFIEVLKKEYAIKQDELSAATKSNRDELVKLEASNTQAVLNDVYSILAKISVEENITIVVDKNNVLYGQASQDITEKVRDRMRGR
jgi:Skp family chaperone for outer membrane proteins